MIRYEMHKGVEKIKTKTFLAFSAAGLVLGGGAMSLAVFGSAHAASTSIVAPGNTQWSTSDTRPGGEVNFIADTTSPAQPGALQLTTDSTTTSKAQYMHGSSTALSGVTELSYYTKQNSAAFAQADPSYQLVTCLDGLSGTTCNGFTTFVYEPYENTAQGTVTNGIWQQWHVDAGQMWSSKTYASPSMATCSVTAGFGGAPFYTLAGLKTACPNAVVEGYGVNIGSNNPSYNVETDLLSFNGTAYNFVTTSPLSSPSITYPANGATITTVQADKIDWTNVTGATAYQYRSFTDAAYTSQAYDSGFTLSASQIPTPNTPSGTYYLQVRAMDADGNVSPWSNDATHPYVVHIVAATTPPTTKDECRDNGWKTFNNPSYKNKDKCIDYVVAHGHRVSGDVTYTANGLKRSADFDMNTYDNNKGDFEYSDANHTSYKVNVSVVKVSGQDAWFAGVVTKSSNQSFVSQWLFAKVHNGNPDQISGSFTDQATAIANVNAMSAPADGPFNVTKGNLKVN